jgi:CubicO group peptidase (beta-lactamase class C family)
MRPARSTVLATVTLLAVVACSPDERRAAREPVLSPTTPDFTVVEPLAPAQMRRNLDFWFGGPEPIHPTVLNVLVSRTGELVVDRSYDRSSERSHDVASVTKSVVSTLVGIAVDDGLLALDDRLGELLPSYAGSMTPQVADLTLERLLTMTAGLPPDVDGPVQPFMASHDWVARILQDGLHGPVGAFVYSSATSHLLGAIVAAATGRSLAELAEERLFAPLGIDTHGLTTPLLALHNMKAYDAAPVSWPVDPSGRNIGWGYLKLRARDLLRIGQLYLAGGTWNGRRIVSEDWVEQATTDHLPIPEPGGLGYGFQWWVTRAGGAPAAVAMGFGGQLIEVVPEHAMVVVTTSTIRDPPVLDPGGLLELVHEALFEQS